MDGNLDQDITAVDKKKIGHKKWRAMLKKVKRKAKRQIEAQQRDALEMKEEETRQNSPRYQMYLQQQEEIQAYQQYQEEERRKYSEALWKERDRLAVLKWQSKKEWEEKEKKRREEEDKRIKEEWEEQQKREKKEQEEMERKQKEKKEKQEALLKEATANARPENGESWHNPLAPPSVERQIESCTFFIRTGACRFGNRCSRDHPEPENSTVLLFPAMYAHFGLEQSTVDDYDTDIALEYEDSESYQHFRDFYNDVLPEFKEIGKVIQFKVSCNHEPHLRGNVYVQFKREEEARECFAKFNGRWYGGRQLSCEFTNIVQWRRAICGQFHTKTCPKGISCNFLHVFRNPGNEFWEADRDFEVTGRRFHTHGDRNRYRGSHSSRTPYYSSRYRTRSRSRSRSPSYRSSRHRRSRSQSPSKRRHHSRSPSRSRRRSSRSPSKSRRHSRSPSRSRRHYSRSSKYSRAHSRSPSRSNRRSKSPSKSRRQTSRSPSEHRENRSRSWSPTNKRKQSRSPEIKKRKHSESPTISPSITNVQKPCSSSSESKSPSPAKSRSSSPDEKTGIERSDLTQDKTVMTPLDLDMLKKKESSARSSIKNKRKKPKKKRKKEKASDVNGRDVKDRSKSRSKSRSRSTSCERSLTNDGGPTDKLEILMQNEVDKNNGKCCKDLT